MDVYDHIQRWSVHDHSLMDEVFADRSSQNDRRLFVGKCPTTHVGTPKNYGLTHQKGPYGWILFTTIGKIGHGDI